MSVVDASVAVKWFVTEPYHSEAIALLGSGATLFAPDLILVEVANVLRRKFKRGELTEVHWREAIAILPRYFDRLIPSADLIGSAVEIALKLDHPVYDCLYVAVAAAKNHALVSADQVLVDKCQRAGFADSVIALDEWHRKSQRTTPDNSLVRKALDLYAQFERTSNVATELKSTSMAEGRLGITRSEDLKPAFDSSAYGNLRKFIIGAGQYERAQLLALGWLGQGYSGDDWSTILRRAEDYLSDDPTLHIDYLISNIGHIESGLAKRRTGQADPALDDLSDEA